MKKAAVLISATFFVSACSVMPDVTYRYYPPKAQTTISVTQTLDCSSGNIVIVNAVNSSTVYSSDRTQRPREIRIATIDGPLADSTVGIKLTDDGRLKTINAETTGQAEAVLKSAVSLGAALAPLALAEISPCDILKSATNGGKSATIKYSKLIDFGSNFAGGPYKLTVARESEDIYRRLSGKIPGMHFTVNTKQKSVLDAPANYDGDMTGMIPIELNHVANVHVAVIQTDSKAKIWDGDVNVPINSIYTLPIPKSALFGNQKFSLTLSDAGVIQEVSYSKATGAAGPANVIAAAAKAATPKTAADLAAELKGEADVIAQSTRLARCRAKPSACT
jgi:hypothetical protein